MVQFEFDNEQKLADRLEELKWQYVDKKEYSVELFLDSTAFFKLVADVQKLKNEFSFVLNISYDSMGKTLTTFERIWYFNQ